MDAVEFVKAIQRSATEKGWDHYVLGSKCDAEKLVSYYEQWDKKHPIKTRQSVFLEQYPEAMLDENGVMGICPFLIIKGFQTDRGGCYKIDEKCSDCRRNFWMHEVEQYGQKSKH